MASRQHCHQSLVLCCRDATGPAHHPQSAQLALQHPSRPAFPPSASPCATQAGCTPGSTSARTCCFACAADRPAACSPAACSCAICTGVFLEAGASPTAQHPGGWQCCCCTRPRWCCRAPACSRRPFYGHSQPSLCARPSTQSSHPSSYCQPLLTQHTPGNCASKVTCCSAAQCSSCNTQSISGIWASRHACCLSAHRVSHLGSHADPAGARLGSDGRGRCGATSPAAARRDGCTGGLGANCSQHQRSCGRACT